MIDATSGCPRDEDEPPDTEPYPPGWPEHALPAPAEQFGPEVDTSLQIKMLASFSNA